MLKKVEYVLYIRGLLHKTFTGEKLRLFNRSYVPMVKSVVKLGFSDFTGIFLRLKFYATGPRCLKYLDIDNIIIIITLV